MKPFKLSPVYKTYLWGGTKLIKNYGKHTNLPLLAESWELSAHPAGLSIIASGSLKGMPFSEFISKFPNELGSKYEQNKGFPILIKLIDAQQNLSVQVHPDDTYAQRNGLPCGKTEMWAVLEAEPYATLLMGFRKQVTKEEFAYHIQNGTLEDILRSVPVKAGDIFFIPAGTVHAIGKGIVVAEIQQNSDATYRVYDYGRLDKEGKPRELHIEKALDVTRLCASTDEALHAKLFLSRPEVHIERLIKCEYFTVERIELLGTYCFSAYKESFCSLLFTDGSASLSCGGESLDLAKGDCVFIPSSAPDIIVAGKCVLLNASM